MKIPLCLTKLTIFFDFLLGFSLLPVIFNRKPSQMKTDELPTIDKQTSTRWSDRLRFKPVQTDAEAVYQALQARIRADRPSPAGRPARPQRVSIAWKYISFAASFGLLIALSVMAYLYDEKDAAVSLVRVTAMPGSRTQVFLPDGTQVWLNEEASVCYPQTFSGAERVVECSGEAVFDVQKDGQHPFVVRMQGMQVKVLGTLFNIYNDPVSGQIETTLLEGQVALFKEGNTTDRPDLILHPDQQAVFNKKNGEIICRAVRAPLYTAWRDRSFTFEENTLEEIMQTLERAFRIKIHIQGQLLKNKRLTASFTHRESLDEILSVLQISARYHYKNEKGIVYIMEK